MATKRASQQRFVSEPIESPLQAFRVGAGVQAMQDQVREQNARYRRTNEHILMATAAWSAYRKFRGRTRKSG